MKSKSKKKHNVEKIMAFPFHKGRLQIFEVMQLIEIERAYKGDCMVAITRYKKWRQEYHNETDIVAMLYLARQGEILRRHAQDFIQSYWQVRTEYREAYANYIKTNCFYVGCEYISMKKQGRY